MAKSFNQAIIMGNLTRDPELKTTPNGQSVATFAVATNRVWQDPAGERKEAVEFHEIVAWGKLAELTNQYLSKGRKVMVVGRLQTRSWETDGVKHRRTEIVANDINFLDRPSEKSENIEDKTSDDDKGKQKKNQKSEDVVIEDLPGGDINLDDIPF